jgi:hypothetical protein
MIKWLRNLGGGIKGLYGLLTSLWAKVLDIKNKTLSLFTDIHNLVSGVEEVVNDIRNFDINPKWNSRVISAPQAVSRIKELYDIPARVVGDVKDLVQILRQKIEPMEVEPGDVEALDELPLKLVKVGERAFAWVTLILDALIAIENAVADLNDIVDALRTTLEDLQGLDALFLTQGSTKRMVDISYRKRQRS